MSQPNYREQVIFVRISAVEEFEISNPLQGIKSEVWSLPVQGREKLWEKVKQCGQDRLRT